MEERGRKYSIQREEYSQVKNGRRAEHVPGMAGHPSNWSLAWEDVGTEDKAQK